MALRPDQVLREQAFLRAHPEWAIYAQGKGSRFVGETRDGNTRHVVAAISLKGSWTGSTRSWPANEPPAAPSTGTCRRAAFQFRRPAVQAVTRRLAAHGFGVDSRDRGNMQEIVILNVSGARSCLDITGSGYALWRYEPRTGPATNPTALAAIILHIFGAPAPATSADAYRAFTLKGAAGRQLQDRGLHVSLQVDKDLESFEAAAEIEVTSPAQPRRGSVRLNDEGELEWECGYGAAFHGDAARFIDTIAPVLRQGTGTHTRSALRRPPTF